MFKKNILYVVVIASIVLTSLTGCQSSKTTSDVEKVVYLINGALGDNAFYDSGQLGIDKIAEQYGVETRTIETNFDAGQYEPALQAAVEYADVIFVISYGFEDQLKEYADKYPEKIFVNIDTIVQNDQNTITSVDFVEEESAYLAGVVAALVTTDTSIPNVNENKLIGAVGGDVDPVIDAFVFAYTNGAHSIDPEITVETKYLGDWEDTAKGKQAALQLYDMGADIVFQIASAAGMGVLQAAGERDLYAIGVDTNQNDIVPGHVVASDIKDVGKAIEEVFATIKDGTYQPGQILKYGLASGAVDVVFDATETVLPQSIVDTVSALRDQIINGELVIELYQAE
ncbi:MAG: BMP family ABC transporter substrate-binding protein [Anaerolineaceae bacterium]|jgi:basic membrane protein A|nr:MAG: BMP family ABC transporter substrate-binding protein [Anaerolineaceae bacterium]